MVAGPRSRACSTDRRYLYIINKDFRVEVLIYLGLLTISHWPLAFYSSFDNDSIFFALSNCLPSAV